MTSILRRLNIKEIHGLQKDNPMLEFVTDALSPPVAVPQ